MEEAEEERPLNRRQIVIVLGYVTDNNGCCLLVRRNEPDHPGIHHRWELPGGRVEFGEELAVTAEREVLEETGVIATALEMLPFSFVTVRRNGPAEINPIMLCFRCQLVGTPQHSFEYPSKIAEARWVPIPAVRDLDLQDGSRFFFQYLSH
jgi:8-oxo-dGTP diphosphatase